MGTVAELRPHLEAVITHLENHADGFAIGDGEKPPGSIPYAVIYVTPGGRLDGPVSDPEADLELVVQATCVGGNQGEALWVRDRVVRIFKLPFHVVGREVTRVRVGGPTGVDRDDDHQPPLSYATPLFRITTSPA